MANEPVKYPGGLYLDADLQIVHEAPEDGTQLVPPGGVLDDVGRALIKAHFGVDGDRVDELVAPSGGADVEDAEVVEDDAADGTVDQVLERVGDDPEAAREALDAEQAKENPRVTLVEQLERIAGGE